MTNKGFPYSSIGKESACNAGDSGLIPGLGRSPGEGNGNPLQYCCLENPMDKGAWWATVHGVTRIKYDLVTKAPPRPTRESQELSEEENKRWPFSHPLKCPSSIKAAVTNCRQVSNTDSLWRSPWPWLILCICTPVIFSYNSMAGVVGS